MHRTILSPARCAGRSRSRSSRRLSRPLAAATMTATAAPVPPSRVLQPDPAARQSAGERGAAVASGAIPPTAPSGRRTTWRLIGAEVLGFLTGPGSVAGRSAEYANTLGSVLLPDMLIVQTDKDPATAGWLTWLPLAPFANGYGGRKLGDDVVDLALLAVFGDPFGADPAGAAGKEA